MSSAAVTLPHIPHADGRGGEAQASYLEYNSTTNCSFTWICTSSSRFG